MPNSLETMIELGAALSLIVWPVLFYIGVRRRYWTPRRVFFLGIFSSVPLVVGVLIQMVIDGRMAILLPMILLMAAVVTFCSYLSAVQSRRKRWRERYHIKTDDD